MGKNKNKDSILFLIFASYKKINNIFNQYIMKRVLIIKTAL